MDVAIRRDEAAAALRAVAIGEARNALCERGRARQEEAARARLVRRLSGGADWVRLLEAYVSGASVSLASALARQHLSPGLVDDIVAAAARRGLGGEDPDLARALWDAAQREAPTLVLPAVMRAAAKGKLGWISASGLIGWMLAVAGTATAARSGAWGEVLGEAARPDESGFALPPALLCLDAVDTASSRLFEQKK